jgi:hypothetical protein
MRPVKVIVSTKWGKYMLRTFVFIITLVAWSSNIYAETLAKTRTWSRQFVLEASGDPWKKDCDLVLSGDGFNSKAKISLKQESGLCSLFGPVTLFATDSNDRKSSTVFVEAAHGGDGDHSGPILDVFSLRNNQFKKLGSQELFDANYQRIDGAIVSVTGKVLFSFCDVCDGPDAADPNDNVYVPAILTIGCGGICVKPHISKQERSDIIAIFKAGKTRAMEEKENPELQTYVKSLEKDFNEFLQRK